MTGTPVCPDFRRSMRIPSSDLVTSTSRKGTCRSFKYRFAVRQWGQVGVVNTVTIGNLL